MKEEILKELLSKKGEFISGQLLSKKLGISRTAVWKHINALRQNGYKIESVSSKGYKLVETPGLLFPEEIYPLLQSEVIGRNIIYRKSISSTSDLAKQIALSREEGTVIIAEEQTKGRGRMGRCWVSPPGTGIWMSVILKPAIRPDKAYQMTQAAAVAVVKSIREVTGLEAGIKWPNDIIVNGKKVCGILTEMSAEPDRVSYIVLGIGVNVNTDLKVASPSLVDRATSLKEELGKEVSRKQLLIAILKNIEEVYFKFIKQGSGSIVEDCRKYSVLLGREIKLVQMDKVVRGRAIDIRNDGVLVVETPGGIVEAISGDVTVRGINGYL